MWEKSLEWVRTTFGTESKDDNTRKEERRVSNSVELYECPDCGNVYIRTESQPCSNCNSDVKAVPNERDLGLRDNYQE